jgi:hypothetical protein
MQNAPSGLSLEGAFFITIKPYQKYREPPLSGGSTVIIPNNKLLLASFDVGHSIAHGSDLLGIFVRDLSAEFIFKRHDQFNEIQ